MDAKPLNPELNLIRQVNQLSTSNLGGFLNQRELEMIVTHGKIMDFSKDAKIMQQGIKTDGVYIILEGSVLICSRIMDAGVKYLETLEPGQFIGEVGFIEKGPCVTSAIAKCNVSCLFLPRSFFELLTCYFPEVRYKILKAITVQVCERIKPLHDKVAAFIANSEMASLSFLGKVIHSLTQPKQLTLSSSGIDKNQLHHNTILRSFSDAEVDLLLKYGLFLETPKNCILIHENEKLAVSYVVIHGAVQSSLMQDNKLAKLSVIGPGSLFANITCVDSDFTLAVTFITCEAAILLKLSAPELQIFQQEHPQLWYKLFNLMCESLVALGKSIVKLDIRLHNEVYNR